MNLTVRMFLNGQDQVVLTNTLILSGTQWNILTTPKNLVFLVDKSDKSLIIINSLFGGVAQLVRAAES